MQVSRRLPELLTARSGLEKRKLLDFVVSNSVWRDGELEVTYRKPFDLIALAAESKGTAQAAVAASGDLCPEWQAIVDTSLTLTAEVERTFERLRDLRLAA